MLLILSNPLTDLESLRPCSSRVDDKPTYLCLRTRHSVVLQNRHRRRQMSHDNFETTPALEVLVDRRSSRPIQQQKTDHRRQVDRKKRTSGQSALL